MIHPRDFRQVPAATERAWKRFSPRSGRILGRFARHGLGLMLLAVAALAPRCVEAIQFESIADEPFHMALGAELQGTLFAFEVSFDYQGSHYDFVNGSGTFYMADAYGNGYGFTATHVLTAVLEYDPNAALTISTGGNFKTDRGFTFAVTGHEAFPDSDITIFKFRLDGNLPGLVNNTIGTAAADRRRWWPDSECPKPGRTLSRATMATRSEGLSESRL